MVVIFYIIMYTHTHTHRLVIFETVIIDTIKVVRVEPPTGSTGGLPSFAEFGTAIIAVSMIIL